MEEGRRLENLSWRIWNRETFCCESQPQLTRPAIDLQRQRPGSRDIPELSASVDSAASDEEEEMQCRHPPHTLPLDIKRLPRKASIESHTSSRGREKHLTSLGLEKMVISIKEKKELEPLSPSIAEAVPTCLPTTNITPRPTTPAEQSSQHSPDSSSDHHSSPSSSSGLHHSCGSETSAELITSHSIVRGFSPGHASSFRSHTHLAPAPVPIKSSMHNKTEECKKKGGGFILGGSSGEDDSSFEEQMSAPPGHKSSLTAELRRSTGDKKTTSFKDEVESRTINHRSHEDEDVFESDDEDDVVESAIEDEEDSSDWEDDATDSGTSSVNEKQLFKRVDSKANLTSRRSLLTTMIHQPDRAAALMEMASKSQPVLRRSRTSTPNGPSVAGTPDDETHFDSNSAAISRSKPIIMTTSNTHPPALSPRTTRRNMLATELTESLRKHLLWERQQKNTTANAVLKRRHTAHDMTNLKHLPAPAPGATSKTNSWQPYDTPFGDLGGGYNEKGW